MRALLILLPLLTTACVRQEAAPFPRGNAPAIPVALPPQCSVGSLPVAHPLPTNGTELREWLLWQDRVDAASRDRGNQPDLEECKVHSIPGRTTDFFVIEDYGFQRYAGVYRIDGKCVNYLGSLGTHGSNGLWDVAGFEILTSPQLDNPIVAVYATTSHGNGSFFVYEIGDAEPVELLERRGAIGEGWKGETSCMVPTWIDFNSDGFTDLVLTGTCYTVYWDSNSATKEALESYVWNPITRCFDLAS